MNDSTKCQESLNNISVTQTKIKLNTNTIDKMRDQISNLQSDNITLRQFITEETEKYKPCTSNGGSVNRKYIRKPKSRSSRTRRTNYRKKTTRRRK
jgi:hypothetical protein